MTDTPVRSVEAKVVIVCGDSTKSVKEFLIYPGTETIYGQVMDLAISEALKEASLKAADLIQAAGDSVSEEMQIEAVFGSAVLG